MKNYDNKLDINLKLKSGEDIIITIYPKTKDPLFKISSEEAFEFGESEYQISEGCSYEYWLNNNEFNIEEIPGILYHSKNTKDSGGYITPGIYTGTLKLKVINLFGDMCGFFNLEVCSVKTAYRTDYRTMLEEITEKCTDLIMQYNSPTTQYFNPSYDADSRTLYQRFAFIRSIIISDEFQNAYNKIVNSPVVKWDIEYDYIDIRNTKKLYSHEVKQIISSTKRTKIPENNYLTKKRIDSLPDKIYSTKKKNSLDTSENRFVKHALNNILFFISIINSKMVQGSREKKEAQFCENILEDFLSHSIFKEISDPTYINLNSPILQRKEGYREIYKVWLMFDLASKLIWKNNKLSGSDNESYDAGKRDIAKLYEYWLFFKLLDILKKIFSIDSQEIDELIEETNDGLGLKLKSGEHIAIEGLYCISNRKMKVKFSYNFPFEVSDYPNAGSWSVAMRPDYTLSIWPEEFSINEAEKQEIILHIHFDAKYKVENYTDLFNKKEIKEYEELDELEEIENREPEKKRAYYKKMDLLKMHAYKDAIRRTAGAYVLYPGTEKAVKQGFHEIIPGLGAFAIRPSKDDTGISQLSDFIKDVFENYLIQTSKHERLSYHIYDIYKDNNNIKLKQATPEKYNSEREKPPSEIYVLIGYIQGKQINWVIENKLYNIRFDIPITPQLTGAKYLLLYDISCFGKNNCIANKIYRITKYPKLISLNELKEKNYPDPSAEEYFIFEIEEVENEYLKNIKWDIYKLEKYNKELRPFSVNLAELMNVLVEYEIN